MSEGESTLVRIDHRDVLLCVGPGGVGKTTCAAAMALAAARAGRRVIVVTVDPSRRLGQALGLEEGAASKAGRVVPVEFEGARLDALLLDSATVFDEIVRRCAPDPASAETTMANPFYRAARERLGGAFEYAAMAQLQLLHADAKYDLVVLDTPPTANALYLLEAPTRLRGLIDNAAARVLAGRSSVGQRILGLGTGVLVRTLRAVAGGQFITDLGDFLRDFTAVLIEFQRRGGEFEALLTSEKTGVVLVSSAAEFAQREAVSFLEVLTQRGLRADGVVLNRVDPPVDPLPDRATLVAALKRRLGTVSDEQVQAVAEVAAEAYAAGQLAGRVRETIAGVHPDVPIVVVPRKDPPPEGLHQLAALGACLIET